MVLYEPSEPKKNTYLKKSDCDFLVRTLEKYGYIFDTYNYDLELKDENSDKHKRARIFSR